MLSLQTPNFRWQVNILHLTSTRNLRHDGYMRYRLPPLNALRLFEASARLLSFKNAAEELLLTPSAVSHGIQALEDWLATPLFQRTARGLVLTDAGRSYYPVVRDALDQLAAGSNRIGSRHGAATQLAISAAPTFATRWLVPRLPGFRSRYPDIAVMIDTAHERTEFSDAGVDLAIRMGRGGWQGLVADRLFGESLVPVRAPALLPQVKDITRFADAPLIHVISVSEDWSSWVAASGLSRPDPTRGLRFDTIQMAFEAACQGLGVAIGRKPLVDAYLQNGRLVELWQPAIPSQTAYWLVGSEACADEPAIVAFRRWIAAEAAASQTAG
jgi:DNA-binding transcriptional LysR family regulator